LKKPRPRTQRRENERDARKLVREREKLASLENSRSRPIEVVSSSVIAVRARATPCHQCGAVSLRLDEETAESAELRAAHMSCQRCSARRTLWFRIAPAFTN
jgi:hypothetical protein